MKLWRVRDVPMRVGRAVPPECQPLFSCQTGRGKFIRICGEQDAANVAKWRRHSVSFRSGKRTARTRISGGPLQGISLVVSFARGVEWRLPHFHSLFEWRLHLPRVSGSKSGAGVEVDDAKGKKLSTMDCAESPAIFPEYLHQSLPCDPQNPHGAAACKKDPYPGK